MLVYYSTSINLTHGPDLLFLSLPTKAVRKDNTTVLLFFLSFVLDLY